ncbi:MAG: hypothetical protein SPG45_10210 [Lactobacillus johnsonii]|jgi:hypothetical protein|nr:hypothetical protein [Lactobacillus johnsonii]
MELIDNGRTYCTNYSGICVVFAKNRKFKIIDDKIYFYCTRCKQYKELKEFEFRKDNPNHIRSECKYCRTQESRIYHYMRRRRFDENQTKEKIIHIDRLKQDKEYHYKTYLINHSKQRAKKKGIEFTITPDDIIIPDKCPILNKPFILLDNKYNYSLDRVDNTKGYIPGNVKIVSRLANTMKNNATNEELEAFAHNILNYIKK